MLQLANQKMQRSQALILSSLVSKKQESCTSDVFVHEVLKVAEANRDHLTNTHTGYTELLNQRRIHNSFIHSFIHSWILQSLGPASPFD